MGTFYLYNKILSEVKKTAKRRNVYFTSDVQDAILKYCEATDPNVRNFYYTKYIHKPLNKLAKMVIRTFHYSPRFGETEQDFIHEVEIKLMDNLHKFDPSRGTKAYSYFTKAAKNYCIQYTQRSYRDENRRAELDEVDEDDKYLVSNEYDVHTEDTSWFKDEFLEKIYYELPNEFDDINIIKCGQAVIDVLLSREKLDDLGNDTFYMYIRQMTNASSIDVKYFVRWLGQKYKEEYRDYDHGYWK